MSKKPVIVFEGVEGTGKSHHINNVSKYLKKKKIEYIKIREPGGNINSEKIRQLILDKKYRNHIQKNTLNKFKYTNSYISEKVDNYRKKILNLNLI